MTEPVETSTASYKVMGQPLYELVNKGISKRVAAIFASTIYSMLKPDGSINVTDPVPQTTCSWYIFVK